jgi:hypothetical protein
VTTNWICAQAAVGTAPNDCAVWDAHGVFKNIGGAGSAVVHFEAQDDSGTHEACTSAIPETPAGGVVEASCQVPFLITGNIAPPIAIVPSGG